MLLGLLDYVNLSGVLVSRGRYGEALAACEMGLRLHPELAGLHANRAAALLALDRQAEALASAERALALEPALLDAHLVLARALDEQGEPERARERFEEALRLAPEAEAAHCVFATHLLLRGDLARGLAEQEWHWRGESALLEQRYGGTWPLWDGEPGRRLLVVHEQGIGDTIQMVRYLPALRARAAHVTLICAPELLPLLRAVAGADDVLPRGAVLDVARYDAYVRMMSLPRLLGTTLETIPAEAPYLQPDPALVEAWSVPLAQLPAPRIGLTWAGNPLHSNDRERSIPLAAFAPLREIPGLSWIALQKGERADEPAPEGLALERLGPSLADLAQTAAVVAQLDLVVTVDTAVAHLAGALGRPVWMLVARRPDWRWLLDRDETPWYPTMRLFRRRARESWGEAIGRLCEALRERL